MGRGHSQSPTILSQALSLFINMALPLFFFECPTSSIEYYNQLYEETVKGAPRTALYSDMQLEKRLYHDDLAVSNIKK